MRHTATTFKVAIVGLGKVGATVAYAMMLSGTPSELVLFAREKKKAVGEKLDLEHALPFLDYVKITATDDYADLAGSNLVVITAGVAQKPGETRLDLCKNNASILEVILPKITKAAPDAIVLIIANPVDVLVNIAHAIVPTSGGRIFGSGTTLDTARFRYHLAEHLKINSRSIHVYVLGEHGDTSFPVYQYATVGGTRLLDFDGMTRETILRAYELARNAAYNIIEAKGATYYAIGVVATQLMETIASDAKTIFPLSVPLHNYYGHSGVSLSVPCVLGKDGVEKVLRVELSAGEEEALAKSVTTLKQYC
jgi:L-lactate dehydrogenase